MDSITDSVDINLSKLREKVKDRNAWCGAGHEITKQKLTIKIDKKRSNIEEENSKRNENTKNCNSKKISPKIKNVLKNYVLREHTVYLREY